MDSEGRLVLVTGANGFVGSCLTRDLLEKGYRVRAMVRTTSKLAVLDGLEVEYVFGEMTDPSTFSPALEGIGTVFHAAGVTKARDPNDYYRVNTDGTEALLRACLDITSVERFVYISSQAAAGPSEGDRPRKEDDPPNPFGVYGQSKLDGEAVCWEAAGRGLGVTVVRPCAVYGPREREGLSLFRMVNRRIIPTVLPNTCLSLIHVVDLVDLIERAGRIDVAEGRTYFAADPTPYWMESVVRIIGRVLGRRVLFIPVAPQLLRPVATINELLLKVGVGVQFLTRERIREAEERYWSLDVTRAQEELGWRPMRTLEERVRETAEWYIDNGWLKSGFRTGTN